MEQTLLCQSCAMPLEKDEDCGINADGSLNKEYCFHCFQGGEFTDPDLTLEEMLNKIDVIMTSMEVPAEVIKQAQQIVTSLKRWQQPEE